MIISALYSFFFIPSNTSEEIQEDKRLDDKSKGFKKMLGPLRVFAPQLFRHSNGKISKQYGIFMLGLGVFFGVLATGYIPVLIQMYATDAFGFGPTENGYLMSFNSLIRGLFLSFAFPRIIALGRKWYLRPRKEHGRPTSSYVENFPAESAGFGSISAEQEPAAAAVLEGEQSEEGLTFDLSFLKWSLVVDGLLTGAAAFSRKGWQMYVAAFLLPLASGSGPAAKGVITQMCPASMRSDAISAITLIEMIATISTSE